MTSIRWFPKRDQCSQPYAWATPAPKEVGKARGAKPKANSGGYHAAGKSLAHVTEVKPWERQSIGKPGSRGHGRMIKRMRALKAKGGLISS